MLLFLICVCWGVCVWFGIFIMRDADKLFIFDIDFALDFFPCFSSSQSYTEGVAGVPGVS